MRQRAMIAMALANDPAVLIADEPTTALDVTVQAQIMEVLERLQAERDTAIVLITHDLGLVAAHADRIAVMYAGPDRRGGRQRHAVRRAAPRLHGRPAGRADADGPGPAGEARTDPGPAAEPRAGAARVRVPPAVPVRDG